MRRFFVRDCGKNPARTLPRDDYFPENRQVPFSPEQTRSETPDSEGARRRTLSTSRELIHSWETRSSSTIARFVSSEMLVSGKSMPASFIPVPVVRTRALASRWAERSADAREFFNRSTHFWKAIVLLSRHGASGSARFGASWSG